MLLCWWLQAVSTGSFKGPCVMSTSSSYHPQRSTVLSEMAWHLSSAQQCKIHWTELQGTWAESYSTLENVSSLCKSPFCYWVTCKTANCQGSFSCCSQKVFSVTAWDPSYWAGCPSNSAALEKCHRLSSTPWAPFSLITQASGAGRGGGRWKITVQVSFGTTGLLEGLSLQQYCQFDKKL